MHDVPAGAEGAAEDTRRKAEQALAMLIAEQEAAQQVRCVIMLHAAATRRCSKGICFYASDMRCWAAMIWGDAHS